MTDTEESPSRILFASIKELFGLSCDYDEFERIVEKWNSFVDHNWEDSKANNFYSRLCEYIALSSLVGENSAALTFRLGVMVGMMWTKEKEKGMEVLKRLWPDG